MIGYHMTSALVGIALACVTTAAPALALKIDVLQAPRPQAEAVRAPIILAMGPTSAVKTSSPALSHDLPVLGTPVPKSCHGSKWRDSRHHWHCRQQ